jgi:uncharacterized protein (DUF433 family)
MQLEDYFDFLDPTDIRLKGSRVGIEHVLYEYIQRCQTPEQIAQRFDTLTLEQVYATILYYLHNKETVGKYYADWIEWGRTMREQQQVSDLPFLRRMREAKDRLRREQGMETKSV